MATLAELLALLPDNTTGEIDAADMREIVTELWGEATGTAVESILFNTTATPGSHTTGTIRWSPETDSLEVDTDHGVTIQVGHDLVTHVHNESGAVIPKGRPVRLSFLPAVGQHPGVLMDNGLGDVFGIATHDIQPDTVGIVTTLGFVRNIDTSGFGSGVHIFGNSTGAYTAGVTGSSLGVVVVSHATQGIFLARPVATGRRGGNTAARPAAGMVGVGFVYFDTQINKPIWWTSGGWRDATGTLV